MSELRKGDRVYVLDGKMISDYGPGWIDSMDDVIGLICEVETVYTDRKYNRYSLKGIGCTYEERGLLPMGDEWEVKLQVGDVVIPLMSATTRGNWNDEFYEFIGEKWVIEEIDDNGFCRLSFGPHWFNSRDLMLVYRDLDPIIPCLDDIAMLFN